MAMTVFDVLELEIGEVISPAEEFLVSGSPKDYAQYREVCGLLRGLRTAQKIVKDLSRTNMDDDDDD